MSLITSRRYLNVGDCIELIGNTQCKFLMMSDSDLACYKGGGIYRYFAGWCIRYPARIFVIQAGYWNTIADLTGGTGSIRYLLKT